MQNRRQSSPVLHHPDRGSPKPSSTNGARPPPPACPTSSERDEHQTEEEGHDTKSGEAGGGEPTVGEAIDDRLFKPHRVMQDVDPRACRQRSHVAARVGLERCWRPSSEVNSTTGKS